MKVTMYTINNCPFCDQEKAYLQSKGIAFEEKNLDQNREFLTEMLALGNNFKGVPVTKIEKDDGQSVVLKGFTQEEFDQAFTGNAAAAVPPVVAASDQPNPTPPSQPDPVTPPPVVEPPVVEPPAPTPEPTPPPVVEPPATPTEPQVPTPEAPSDTAVKADDAQTPTPPVNEPETPPAPAPSDHPPSVQSTPANDPLAAILADLQNKSSDVPPGPVVPPVGSDMPAEHVPTDQPTQAPVSEPPAQTQ